MRLAAGTVLITRLAATSKNSSPRYSPVPTWRSTTSPAGNNVSGPSASRRHRNDDRASSDTTPAMLVEHVFALQRGGVTRWTTYHCPRQEMSDCTGKLAAWPPTV